MTGTPLENRVEDLLSIFDFVQPSALSQQMTPQQVGNLKASYFLRRRADDPEVGIQLPDLVDEDIYIDLDDRQAEAYKRVETEGVSELDSLGEQATVTHVFALITKLQQLCNFDPESGESAKVQVLLEDLEEVTESGRKALVFSQFVEPTYGLKRVATRLNQKLGPRFRSVEYHGDVPQGQRKARLDAFRNDPSACALLLNYRTGGTGLNLQVATYIYLFNRWWNPQVEQQAIKRAHRIGQDQKVFVRRFICRGTIEERIVKKLAEKRRLFDEIIDENRPAQSMGLSEAELFNLFDLKVQRRAKHTPAPAHLVWPNLTWSQFEELTAQVYEKQGYSVTRLGGAHDGGIDLLAEKRSAGGTDKLAVQCKHHEATIGVAVVREMWGTVSADPSITHGVIVVSSQFSNDAKDFAHGKRLRFVEGTELKKLASELGVADFHDPPANM